MELVILFKDGTSKSYTDVSWAGREHDLFVIRVNNWDERKRFRTFFPIEDVQSVVSNETIVQ